MVGWEMCPDGQGQAGPDAEAQRESVALKLPGVRVAVGGVAEGDQSASNIYV